MMRIDGAMSVLCGRKKRKTMQRRKKQFSTNCFQKQQVKQAINIVDNYNVCCIKYDNVVFIYQTGREAMIEKKKARNAHYRREASPDLELDDNALLGGDDF